MTVRQDLGGIVAKPLIVTFALTYAGKLLDLTSYTVSVVVKGSQAAADNTGTTYTTSSGLTVLSARAGRVRLTIPSSATGTPGSSWYRVDVANGQGSFSAMCGALTLMSA